MTAQYVFFFVQGIPPQEEWNLDPNASYVYYCANETIHGMSGCSTSFIMHFHVHKCNKHFHSSLIWLEKYQLFI